ncbi:unnamed protein product [Hyaloperonospora brassicae]|uniref:DUF726 domain-containing protein n=1 Tax=Hyaloperonospora brassicae TaxID=162125 RepID=A0AAV0V551_HYABA|nr:unnamed protein product [Hyaloperonospora brassicae]
MDSLPDSQKRGVAGLCACLLPAVTDGSTDFLWSRTYLKIVVEQFLGLSRTQTEAYVPILMSRHQRVAEKTHNSSRAPATLVDDLDPSPFLALVVPPRAIGDSTRRRRDWLHPTTLGVYPLRATKPSTDSNSASDALDESHVRSFRLQLIKQLLWLTIKSVGYDARARTLLRRLVLAMHVQWRDVTQEEESIGQTLYAEAAATLLDQKAARKPKGWDWKRHVAIGAATVTGGALLAVTGGLAAPAIAASLTALGGAGVTIGAAVGSATGVAATTVLFGTAGAGVLGKKAETRTKSVHDVGFDLVSAGDGMNVYICVSGWLDDDDLPTSGFRRAWGDSREYSRALCQQRDREKADQADQADQRMDECSSREGELFPTMRRTYSIDASHKTNGSPGIAHLSKSSHMDKNERGSDSMRFNNDSDARSRSTASTSASSASSPGWERGAKHNQLRAWRWKDRFPHGDQYCLIWDEEVLRRFGKCMRTFAAEQVSTYATTEIVKYTALAALFAAVAIPRAIFRLADIIDNAWTVTMNAADTSGKLLADALRKREQGLRPVTLIGYGMGARLIFSCLKELAKKDSIDESCGIVENAVLLGSPLPMDRDEWLSARRIVSGRLINGYSDNDWMLGIMFRYHGWALNSAGIAPLDIDGVEDVNLSDIIGGHLEYKSKIGVIMDRLRLED